MYWSTESPQKVPRRFQRLKPLGDLRETCLGRRVLAEILVSRKAQKYTHIMGKIFGWVAVATFNGSPMESTICCHSPETILKKKIQLNLRMRSYSYHAMLFQYITIIVDYFNPKLGQQERFMHFIHSKSNLNSFCLSPNIYYYGWTQNSK